MRVMAQVVGKVAEMETRLTTLKDDTRGCSQKIEAQLNTLRLPGSTQKKPVTYAASVKKTIQTREETPKTETMVFYLTDAEQNHTSDEMIDIAHKAR